MDDPSEKQLLIKIKALVIFFIFALILSGITAFPIETGINIISDFISRHMNCFRSVEFLTFWLYRVEEGVVNTNKLYPFMAYGTDWLAFAHIIIAIAFLGVYYKPIRNIWIVYWGMIACVGVIPLAFICGLTRGIPVFWILIDCSFGILGIIPLFILKRYIRLLSEVSGCVIKTRY